MKFIYKLKRTLYRGFKRDRFRVINREGIDYLVNYKNSIDRKLIVDGGYEKEQIACLMQLANKHKCTIFYDIGANIGLYTLSLSRLPLLKKIVAFEPLPANICQFKANLLLNKLHDVVGLKAIGLSDYSGDIAFLGNTGNSTGRSRVKETNINVLDESKFEERVIQVDRLDNLEEVKGELIVIKIDVEGHELNALRGMENLLADNRCILQIESYDINFPEIDSYLTDKGYKIISNIGVDRYYSNF